MLVPWTSADAIAPTDRVKNVVDIAVNRERLAEACELVGTGHLLLAILAEGAGVGARVLERLGADQARVRAALERARAEHGEEGAPA